METADISRLASDLEANPSRDSPLLLPSLQQLYRLGLVLGRILQQNDPKRINDNSVVAAYRELIESIPDESLSSLFGDLQKASQRLLQSSSNNKNPQDLILAVRSMEGLIGAFSDSDSSSCRETESNSRLCRVIYQSAWVSTLAALYDRFIVFEKQQQNNNMEQELELTKAGILSCLSRLVLDGLVLAGNEVVEESLLDAIRAMEEESTDCLRDLQAWQNREEPFRRNLQDSVLAIGNSNNNTSNADEDEALERAQQREYIVSMLESARAEPSSMAVPRSEVKPRANQTANTTNTATNKNTSELDRRIQQVLQILPHFGEGFVEVALGLHQGDVESTVATLLNHHDASSSANYPAALKVLDPKLPRRKREFRAYQTAEEEAHSAMEARRDVKERMALEEKQKQDQYEALVVASSAASQQQQQQQQQQKEAEQASKDASATTPLPDKKLTRKELRQQKLRQLRIRDEYDDDYDDQYDEIDIKLGAADDGFTSDNMTFEQVKLYNQVVQEDESDAAFWESNRNTNQKASKNSGEKKWGPDKIRGGRVIGADGKIVRKPGGVKKKKTNNRNNNSGQNNSNNNGSNNNNNNNKGGKPKANNNNNNGNNNGNSAANNGNKKKPKTKPRSDNRVNRQRDRKMKKQGAFGVQD